MNFELNESIREYINISIKLTTEGDYNKLFESVLRDAMNLTHCDAGTIYRKKADSLQFMVMRNDSLGTYQGGSGEKVDLPDVELSESNICAYCALHREVINIPDVYTSDLFDFTGPRKFDSITGFHTESMLVLPLESHEGEVLGVLQLMNVLDESGHVRPFTEADEFVVRSIASQSAISMANMIHINDMKELLDSAVRAFMTAQLVKTPYDAGHTVSVSMYVSEFAKYINTLHSKALTELSFSDADIEVLRMSGMLHDVGKLALDHDILEKNGRLADRDMERILNRLDLIGAYLEIDRLNDKIDSVELEKKERYLAMIRNLLLTINTEDTLGKYDRAYIDELSGKYYLRPDGSKLYYITDAEKKCLNNMAGVLTEDELKKQHSHVHMGIRILNNIKFGKRYEKVTEYVAAHHEYLDGTGYPKGLKGNEIPIGARMITIANQYDLLVAADRPYRKPLTIPEAKDVLRKMAEDGKLDRELVSMFCDFLGD